MIRRFAAILCNTCLILLAAGGELAEGGRIRRPGLSHGRELPPGTVWRFDLGPALSAAKVTSLAFSPDSKMLAFAADPDVVRLWDPASDRRKGELRGEGTITALAFSPDGSRLAFAAAREGVRVEVLLSIIGVSGLRRPARACTALAFSPDGRTLASASWKDGARLWDVSMPILPRGFRAGGEEQHRRWPPGPVRPPRGEGRVLGDPHQELRGLAFSPDGKSLATAGYDGAIRLWEVTRGEERCRLDGHDNWVASVAFSSDGRRLASTGLDGTVRLWDVLTRKQVRQMGRRGVSVWSAAFSPDGRLLAAGLDADVVLWRVSTGEVCRRLKGHQGTVYAIAFSPDGSRLASVGADRTVLVWDVAGLSKSVPPPPAPTGPARAASAEEREARFGDLASEDSRRAYRGLCALVADPERTVPFLRSRLRPVPRQERRIARLIAELDSDRYAVRERARHELASLGGMAEATLREALTRQPPLEVRRRIEQLLEEMPQQVPSGETLRGMRAVEVLEHIGNAEAQEVLKTLAGGDTEARLTQDARSALERLSRRKP